MKRHNEPSQVKTDLTPSNGELDKLRADMEKKVQTRMNGRLQSRFHQVMLDRGVVKLDQWGDLIMCDPYQFTKMQKAEGMIEAADWKAEDSYLDSNPEEKEAAKERRLASIREIRKQVFGMGKDMKV